jgi:hypothetical protein
MRQKQVIVTIHSAKPAQFRHAQYGSLRVRSGGIERSTLAAKGWAAEPTRTRSDEVLLKCTTESYTNLNKLCRVTLEYNCIIAVIADIDCLWPVVTLLQTVSNGAY